VRTLSFAVGIDFFANESVKLDRGELRKGSLERILINEKFDLITMLAVLEHLEDPELVLDRLRKGLNHRGQIVLTVPSKWAKPVLEFLAFRIGVISRESIREHKTYYDRPMLIALLKKMGFQKIHHRYFQFYMNNLVIAQVEDAGDS
jgi:2-polyprenyl-3-methyl-5-hydroxy-6-metoxy-1,4-benzoquinol methylase